MRRGFSVIEGVLAAAIVGVVFIVVLSMATQSNRLATRGYREELGHVLLMNVVEELTATPFDSDRFNRPIKVAIESVMQGRAQALEYTVRVDPGPGSTGAFFGKGEQDVDVVEVSVSWQESTGAEGRLRPQRRSFQLTVRRPGDGLFVAPNP